MKAKQIFLSVSLTMFLSFSMLGLRTFPVLAQGGETGFVDNCPIGSISPECKPPTLQQLEFLVVRLIYAGWALGGLIWTAYFMLIAKLYFTSDQGKIEEAKGRFGRWIVGLALFYLSRPLIGSFMEVLIKDGTGCYDSFDGTPAFTFFFPDVCT